jgi:F-type H+-transporting ATPase subunit alpha
MKKYAGSLRLDLAQFRELEAFAQMGTELDPATQKQIDRGVRLVEILKQGQYEPMDVADQVAIIYAGTQGLIDKVPVNMVKDFELKYLKHLKDSHSEIIKQIHETGVLKDVDELNKIIAEFVDKYIDSIK